VTAGEPPAGATGADRSAGEVGPDRQGTPLLRLEDISISYRGHEVVHDVSLDVAPGEVIALIGPSGAGKSSLLRCVNFLEVPSQGTVYLEGRPVGSVQRRGRSVPANAAALAEHRREVGMVFQSFNLFPHLSAAENVMLAQVHSLGRSKAEARDRALKELAHVGLASHADAKPAKCSGGQQQRIAIARALAMDPKLMLFDEPTSALDPELGLEVLSTMRRLADEGMTMIVVTHEMHFAQDVADRIVFMADGRIVEQGPARQVMRRPQHERTKRFLAAVTDR
jgi:polar amino acid transport system ATP-binding protein